MKLLGFTLAFLCALAVASDADKGGSDSAKKHHHHHHGKVDAVEKECQEITRLEKLENLVANATALDDKTHHNATKARELEAKASAQASKLAALKGNATLVKDCAIIAAADKLRHDCKKLAQLERFVKFASNKTAVEEKTKGNATKAAEISAEEPKVAAKLKKLEGNSTLVGLCHDLDAKNKDKRKCAEINKLEAFVAFAGNATAVAEKTKGNATETAAIKDKSTKDSALLAKLKNNATLVSTCAALSKSKADSLADVVYLDP
ncbi:hypothetical protein GQ53DRAFT_811464 [Thozetella sp. PMI_491]|nr:hypothetical protein GQ53DRAFT_811464 [Thozetella sp. PMI_491]